jgi:hypothetical protein
MIKRSSIGSLASSTKTAMATALDFNSSERFVRGVTVLMWTPSSQLDLERTAVRIRPRKNRNVLKTDDGFLCVTDTLLSGLVEAGVKGFEHKPLPGSGWQVLRLTNRRKFDAKVYDTPKPACAACQRAAHYGTVRFEREIDLPEEELAFFSTDKPRGQGGYDIFVTDKLRELLVASGAKGGELHRLLTDEEEKLEKQNPKWKPKGVVVSLGQHRYTVND